MAQVIIDLGDRDTKRWHVCLSCLIRELQELGSEAVQVTLDRFHAGVESGCLTLELPAGYRVPQELI